jgi:hypothetical protein
MPRTRKDEAPVLVDEPEITGRYVELADHTVAFEVFHTETDPAPLFHGLPGDRCQCPHWGLVLSGTLEMRYIDRTEVYEAGDAYYALPGHLPWPHSGTEVVEFSPTGALQATMSVLGANMAAAGVPR